MKICMAKKLVIVHTVFLHTFYRKITHSDIITCKKTKKLKINVWGRVEKRQNNYEKIPELKNAYHTTLTN